MTEHYTDEADEADRIENAINDKRIEAIRKKAEKINTNNPIGECWYCGEFIGEKRRFCDMECASGFERNNEYY